MSSQAEIGEFKPREVVCYLGSIRNWESEGENAKLFVGKETQDIGKARVYITARRDFIFAKTNMLLPEAWDTTCILTNRPRSLDVIVGNLVAYPTEIQDDPYVRARFYQAFFNCIEYFVEEHVISDERYDYLDFSGLRNVRVVRGESTTSYAEWVEARKRDAEEVAVLPNSQNPWIPGSFYLAALLSVIVTVRVAFGTLSALAIPLVLVGGLLSVAVIGAFTLRNQNLLKEKPFLELMALSFKYMPLLRNVLPGGKEKSTETADQDLTD